ncbi:MAG: hypothetical protein ACJARR_001482 [Pseudophaeobacter arcticus]|jgi:hypothetical protein
MGSPDVCLGIGLLCGVIQDQLALGYAGEEGASIATAPVGVIAGEWRVSVAKKARQSALKSRIDLVLMTARLRPLGKPGQSRYLGGNQLADWSIGL